LLKRVFLRIETGVTFEKYLQDGEYTSIRLIITLVPPRDRTMAWPCEDIFRAGARARARAREREINRHVHDRSVPI
jgi:hypothetical protein